MIRPRYFASELAPPSPGLSSIRCFSRFSWRWRRPWHSRSVPRGRKRTSRLPSGAMVASSAAWLRHDSPSMSWKFSSGRASASHPPSTWCSASGSGRGFHARRSPGEKGACLPTSLYLFSMFMFLAVVDWCCLVALYDVVIWVVWLCLCRTIKKLVLFRIVCYGRFYTIFVDRHLICVVFVLSHFVRVCVAWSCLCCLILFVLICFEFQCWWLSVYILAYVVLYS